MFEVDPTTFTAMVREALAELPECVRARMDNVSVVARNRPSRDDLDHARRTGEEEELFGLYRGVPLPERGSQYDKVLPDLILVYQEAHERACDTLEELREEVRITVRHELAHHFGIDDDRLEELGAY